jgi:hypothetical protein
LFQTVATPECHQILAEKGIPHLIRLIDLSASRAEANPDMVLFVLKILVMYRSRAGTNWVIRAMRERYAPEAFAWSIVMAEFAGGDHPDARYFVGQVRDLLPRQDFVAIAFLDLANRLVKEGVLEQHPFDTNTGASFLGELLEARDGDMDDYAESAAACLGFLQHSSRKDLLDLARQHPDVKVQMEALAVGAKLGRAEDTEQLAARCRDPRASSMATALLEEHGLHTAVPEETREPEFQAMAEMCSWLGHPMEFGRPPDDVEVFGSRTLHWPPTRDRRRVWLIKYGYRDEGEAAAEFGVGMVGSVTFALFGETTAALTPEDVYALHCCWELQVNADSLAPAERDVSVGRAILSRFNPDF